MSTKNIKQYEIIGIVFTIILGVFLHFAYELSGNNTIVGLFSAINESTWEHLKLFYFPYLIYALFEYFKIGNSYANYLCAKLIGAIYGMLTIIVLFYTYTGIYHNVDWINIAIFIIGVIYAYYTSYRLINNFATTESSTPKKIAEDCFSPAICIILLFMISILFFFFTFNPPDINLFINPTLN